MLLKVHYACYILWSILNLSSIIIFINVSIIYHLKFTQLFHAKYLIHKEYLKAQQLFQVLVVMN
jgi:hypothetical protein